MSDARTIATQAAQALREGRADDAAELFQQLTQVEPANTNHWFNLGWSLRAARHYEAALEAYAEALKRGVRQPEDVHVNRSVILSEYLHRPDEAAEELRQAVKANPGSVSAWLNLGSLAEDFGDSGAARGAYEKALAVDSRTGRAIARIAAIDVHEGRRHEAIDGLKAALGRHFRDPSDAAEVYFALGNAFDAAGDFPAAFQAISEGNRIGSAARAPGFRYDAKAQEQLVNALIAMPTPVNASPSDAELHPIFICGMFRSGSTLTEQLLGRHADITAGGELEFVPAMVREDLQPYPAALTAADPEQFAALREKYVDQLGKLYPDAGRITDKRPDNFLHIALIKAIFPQAPIVHTVRSALDNILSVYFLYFADSVAYSGSLDEIAHYYAQYRRLMNHWRTAYPGSIHDVRYDALVADPRAELEPLLTSVGLQWDAAILEANAAGLVRTPSNWQVRQPLHRKSLGRWRNYAAQLEPIRRRLKNAGLLEDKD